MSTSNLKSDLEALKLSEKSKEQYKSAFDKFNHWCETQNVSKIEETVVIDYFKTLSKSYAPSSLWSFYSMLRLTINQTQKIDISKYTQLIRFLKENAKGFQQKQHKTFTRSEIARFLQEADDTKYLVIKALAICGLFGALKREELTNMQWKHVRDKGDVIEIEVPCTNASTSRLFTIAKDSNTKVDMLGILRRYIKLRPYKAKSERLFLTYRNGKCINTPVGINFIGAAPKMIAKFLKLPDPELYTGHSFRRTAMSLALDANWFNNSRQRRNNLKNNKFSLSLQMPLDECRLCLQSVNVVVDLFAPNADSKDLVKLIEKMTETKIEDTSNWPRKICTDCLTTINEYRKFCQMVKANQEEIRKRCGALNLSPVSKQRLIEIDTIDASAESFIITEETGDTIETNMTFKEEPMDDDDEIDEYVITGPVLEEPQIKTEMPKNVDFEPNDEEPCVKTESPDFSLEPSTSTGSTKQSDLKSKPTTASSLQCDMCPKGQLSTIHELQEHVRKVHGPKKTSQYRGLLFPDRQTSNKYKLVIQRPPKPNIEERLRSLESSSRSEHQHQQKKIRLKMTLNK